MAESIKNLIKTNDFLTSLLNSMPTAVFIVDDHVRVQNVNKAFTKLFHKPAEEVYDELCGNDMGCVFQVKQKKDIFVKFVENQKIKNVDMTKQMGL